MWKFASKERESKPPSFTPAKLEHLLEPVHSPVAVLELPRLESFQPNAIVLKSVAASMGALTADRRLHGRAKVNSFACIRSEAFGDDIMACLDMSRGGLSFKTRKTYLVTTMVRLAVPFSRETPEAPAI